MTMQRRHFELIATTIRECALDDVQRLHVARMFASALRETNPNFQSTKFVDACQPATTYKNRSR